MHSQVNKHTLDELGGHPEYQPHLPSQYGEGWDDESVNTLVTDKEACGIARLLPDIEENTIDACERLESALSTQR